MVKDALNAFVGLIVIIVSSEVDIVADCLDTDPELQVTIQFAQFEKNMYGVVHGEIEYTEP
jgi:hypothetical protein